MHYFDRENKPFNMDALTLARFNDKLDKSNDAAIDGDLIRRYRAIKEVYLNVSFKLTEEEKTKCDKDLKLINIKFKETPIQREKSSMAQFMSLQTSMIEELLDNFVSYLNTLLYKHDIINLKKTEKPHFSDIVEDEYQ